MLYQGARVRARAGNVISTEDPLTGKRIAECSVYFLSRAEEDALRALIPRGSSVVVSGELPGTPLTALVDIGEAARTRTIIVGLGETLVWVAALHIEEA